LTGRVPFPEGDQIAKLYAHDSRPPPSAVECVHGLPPGLDDVIARAMAKDPDSRYQSAGDVGAAALAAVGAAGQTRAERTVAKGEAAPSPRAGELTPKPRRRRVVVAAAALVLVLAVGAVVAFSLGGNGGSGSGVASPRLLALIPPIARENCTPAPHGTFDPSSTASVECSLTNLSVIYQQFPSNTMMNQWYAQQRELAQLSPGSGTCTASAFHGESQLTINGTARGRYLCVLGSDDARLYQTDERFAVATTLDYYAGKGRPAIESLLRQWQCCTTLGTQ
jgi:hypothetical protein